MKFEIIKDNSYIGIEEQYFIEEKAFDCEPAVNVDINIAMAYLNLGVDSEDMCVKCLWGFSPINSWKTVKLDVPDATEGRLKLIGEYETGLTWRIDDDKTWDSYFDKNSGWYCIGNKAVETKNSAVKINDNMIVTIDEVGTLIAVWIKPVFIGDKESK